MAETAACPFTVGQVVQIADPGKLSRELFREASGPDDPNAHLSMDLYDWWHEDKPKVTIREVQPDLNGWYLMVQSPRLGAGDDFGLRSSDVEPVASSEERP